MRSGAAGVALLLVLGMPSQALGQVSFAPPVNYPTGNSPQAVALGDLNRDGKLDLLVANSLDLTVSVRLGDGAGGFGPATDFPVGNSPRRLFLADLNRDGKLDLVVVTRVIAVQTFSILLGDGAGGFGPPTIYSVGLGHLTCCDIASLGIGDLNRDGKLDLVVINTSLIAPGTYIFLGDGSGVFTTPPPSSVCLARYNLDVGDLNGDGKLDVVAANSASFRVCLGDGAGGFSSVTSLPTGGDVRELTLGDVNRDGKLDVVGVDPFVAHSISVFLGDGAGGLGPRTDFPGWNRPSAPILADINRDGKLDIVAANYLEGTVSVSLGNGEGGFAPRVNFQTGNGPTAVAAGDLNGDGKPDLVVPNSVDNTVTVYINTSGVPPSGGFGAPAIMPDAGGSLSVALADLNRDGKLDLLVGKASPNVWVLLGDGAGGFGPPANFATDDLPVDLAVGDLDRDGKLDLVVANQGGHTVSVRLGDGLGGFGPPTKFPTGNTPRALALADLNRDGKLDLVVVNHIGFTVSIFLGDGAGGFGPRTDLPTGSYPQTVGVGDLNRDGKLDLVVLNGGDPSVSVFLGNGDGTFGPRTDLGGWPGALGLSLGLADLNRDGKLDLVVGNPGTRSMSVRLGNGDGTFGAITDYPAGAQPVAFALGDLNGDGLPDLVVFDQPQQAVIGLLANGAGGFGQPLSYPTGLAPPAGGFFKLAVGDVNRDGTIDLVVPNQFGDGAVLLNTQSRLVLTALTCTPPPPQPPNTLITCTASATGGTPPYQAEWWLSPDNGVTWFVVQGWGALTFLWGPNSPSPNTLIGVWLRGAGNGADAFEDGGAIAFPIPSPPPLVFTGINCAPPSPQPANTLITCTASATGGTPPYQAKWWLSPDNGVTWFVVQGWGALSVLWGPNTPTATTLIGVWLRSMGNGADMFEGGGSIPFVVTP